MSRDVQFVEDQQWNWESKKENQNLDFPLKLGEDVDELPVRGTRLLSDIYKKCSVAVLEPGGYEEAEKDPRWLAAMQEELSMIQKNQTWELVERPKHRKVIGVK